MSSSGDIEHPNVERIQNPEEGEAVFDPEENTGQEGEDDPAEDNSIPVNMRDYLKGKLHEAFGQDDDQAIEDSEGNHREKRRVGEPKEEEKLHILYDAMKFVNEMKNAYDKDQEAFSNGQAGTNRLLMIRDVERKMKNSYFARGCRALRIVKVLSDWIRPDVHGTLPNNRIRTGVYKILYEFPVQKSTIKEGRIGELLVKLWRHPKESKENQMLLHQIIEKWLRLVTGVGSDYSENANEGIDDSANERQRYIASVNRMTERGFTDEQEERSVFAMVPKGNLRVYVNDVPVKEPRSKERHLTPSEVVRNWAKQKKRD